jgi:hypothetical protein
VVWVGVGDAVGVNVLVALDEAVAVTEGGSGVVLLIEVVAALVVRLAETGEEVRVF